MLSLLFINSLIALHNLSTPISMSFNVVNVKFKRIKSLPLPDIKKGVPGTKTTLYSAAFKTSFDADTVLGSLHHM